jgi:hypothetical protein
MKKVRVAERHQVEHRRGRPQSRPGDLNQKWQTRNLLPWFFFFWYR